MKSLSFKEKRQTWLYYISIEIHLLLFLPLRHHSFYSLHRKTASPYNSYCLQKQSCIHENKKDAEIPTSLLLGAVEQIRTAEPLPYQGSALPTELQQRIKPLYITIVFLLCQWKILKIQSKQMLAS